jgi:hypothetical protein
MPNHAIRARIANLGVLASLISLLPACGADSSDSTPSQVDASASDATGERSLNERNGDTGASGGDATDTPDASVPSDDASPAIDASGVDDGPSPVDADASGAGDASDAGHPPGTEDASDAQVAATCADGPFITNTVKVRDTNSALELSDITVKASVCGISATTDSTGIAKLSVPRGMESWLRLEAPAKVPTLFPVRTLSTDQYEERYIFDDQYRQGYFPDYDSAKAEILITVAVLSGGTPPCTTADGVTISVVDHPEAAVTYWKGGFPNEKAVGAMSTTITGNATITGLSTGTKVVVDAKKPGCKVVADFLTQAASVELPLETGGVTYYGPVIQN